MDYFTTAILPWAASEAVRCRPNKHRTVAITGCSAPGTDTDFVGGRSGRATAHKRERNQAFSRCIPGPHPLVIRWALRRLNPEPKSHNGAATPFMARRRAKKTFDFLNQLTRRVKPTCHTIHNLSAVEGTVPIMSEPVFSSVKCSLALPDEHDPSNNGFVKSS